MRICMILEGCYPYVTGGVSSWAQQYIQAMPEHDFVLWTIAANEADKGRFKYTLPENVVEVHEVFLDAALALRQTKAHPAPFTERETAQMIELLRCADPDWDTIFSLYSAKKRHPIDFLMSKDFLDMLEALCREEYPYVPFSDMFHMLRSMLLPVLHLLGGAVPEADVYHAICTGYGGLLGALGSWKNRKPLLITEHGIYTREREEELIRAKWVSPIFKPYWIRFFYMLSALAYRRAAGVSCLFENARATQISMGCPAEKTRVIANGIHYDRFCDIPPKTPDGWVDIGAVVRLAPIKDIKTLLYAFQELKQRVPEARLHILGGTDDAEYAAECRGIVERLAIRDVLFTGVVNIIRYMPRIDFTILTSISEGQPLSVLESFAAGRPCVTTDVGCCRALLEGDAGDTLGMAGYCVPPMNKQALSLAMEQMCRLSGQERAAMGAIGRERVRLSYRHETMMEKYRTMYKEATAQWQESVLN